MQLLDSRTFGTLHAKQLMLTNSCILNMGMQETSTCVETIVTETVFFFAGAS